MRNLYLFEKLLVIGTIGFIVVMLLFGNAGAAGKFFAPVFVVGLIWLYFHTAKQANAKAREAVAHVNNGYVSAVEGTGIGLAYLKPGFRAVVQVYANGKRGSYEPDLLRGVGLKDDRKGVYRCILLEVKDPDEPEWLIRFDSEKEAKQWKERIMQFAETGGRA